MDDEGYGIGDGPLDYYEAIDAIGEKILARAEEEGKPHGGASSSTTLPKTSGPRSLDEVGPSGRLVPKGDEEDPGEILHRLKESKLMSDDIEHWSTGTKGDGKIFLNDDVKVCKIYDRGVPYKVGSDGRRIVPTRRPKHLYTPEEWDLLGAVDKMLDRMIFPKIVQCNKIDLELGSSCTSGWEWTKESVQQHI